MVERIRHIRIRHGERGAAWDGLDRYSASRSYWITWCSSVMREALQFLCWRMSMIGEPGPLRRDMR